MADQLDLFAEPPPRVAPIMMGTGNLKYYQGNWTCAHEGCEANVQFKIATDWDSPVKCKEHRDHR